MFKKSFEDIQIPIKMPFMTIIQRQIKKIEQELEEYLIQQTGKEDWNIEVFYNYITKGRIRDQLIIKVCSYDKNDKQREFIFLTGSNELIFFKRICEVILKVTNEPEKYYEICNDMNFNFKFEVRYIQDIKDFENKNKSVHLMYKELPFNM